MEFVTHPIFLESSSSALKTYGRGGAACEQQAFGNTELPTRKSVAIRICRLQAGSPGAPPLYAFGARGEAAQLPKSSLDGRARPRRQKARNSATGVLQPDAAKNILDMSIDRGCVAASQHAGGAYQLTPS